MSRPALRDRILGALALSPMTDADLTRCLATRGTYVQVVRGTLLKRGLIRIVGYAPQTHKRGRHPYKYGVVA